MGTIFIISVENDRIIEYIVFILSRNTDVYIEPLDGTRVHPENYEWARKMAEDALEYEEVMDMPIIQSCILNN